MTSLSWGGRVVGQDEAEVHGKEQSNRETLLGLAEETEGADEAVDEGRKLGLDDVEQCVGEGATGTRTT